MYRVIEAANILGVSKVTIYKKMSLLKKELKPFIHKKRNITFIEEEGLRLIKESLVANHVIADTELKDKRIEELANDNDKYLSQLNDFNARVLDLEREHIEDLKLMISTLESQVNLKKSQLQVKKQLIKNFQDLVAYNKMQISELEQRIEQLNEV